MRTNRVGAKLAAVASIAAVAMTAFAPAAAAATGDSSTAEARFLSGSGGGVDFDTVAALEGVAVKRSGDNGAVKEANPLKGSLLGQSLPEQPNGITIPLEFTELGVVNQYAKASPRAKAVAASGAVANGGAINTTNDKSFPEFATLDLAKVPGLPKEVTEQLLDLKLNIGAVSAVAAANASKNQQLATKCADLSNPKQCRDYNIAGANVHLRLPLLQEVVKQLKPLTDQFKGNTVDAQSICDEAENQNAQLADALQPLCDQASNNPLLEVESTPPDLNAIMDSVTSAGSGGGLEIDLRNGTVDVDLAKYLKSLGLDLNNLPPNTELVQYVVKALSDRLPSAVQHMVVKLTDKVQSELGKSSLDLRVKPTGEEISLSSDELTPVLDPIIQQLKAAAFDLTKQLQDGSDALGDGVEQLQQLITIHANVQDSPADGVFRETALKIELLKGALPSGAKLMPSAPGNSAVEINLAQAQVGAALGSDAPADTPEDIPAGNTPPKDGPNLPNTGAGTLDLPFLLLGLGLVTGGLWIIMYGRSEQLDL